MKVFYLYNEQRWWKDKVVAHWQGGVGGKESSVGSTRRPIGVSEAPPLASTCHILSEKGENEGRELQGREVKWEKCDTEAWQGVGRKAGRDVGVRCDWEQCLQQWFYCLLKQKALNFRWNINTVREKQGRGNGGNKGIKGPMVWVTSDIISSRFHFNSSSSHFAFWRPRT